jgi:acyl carrier protein
VGRCYDAGLMSEDAFRAALAGLAGVPPDALTDVTEIVPANWDSVAVLDLIAAIDEAYGVTVDLGDVQRCKTAGELVRLIDAEASKR